MRPLLNGFLRSGLTRAFVLLVVIGLVFAPPVLVSYNQVSRADVAYQESDFLRAAELYEHAAGLLPWRPDLWNLAGIARFRTGEYQQAIRLLTVAKRHDTLTDVGWDVLGISNYQLGNIHQAVDAWETGLNWFPNYAKYHYHLIYVYREMGDIPAERHSLEKWTASEGGNDAAAHYRLGTMLSVEDSNRALNEFLLAASLNSDYDPVVETMRTAINLASLEEEESPRLVIIGRGLGLIGEWGFAEEAFRQAVDADADNPEAWAWLGETGQHLGRSGRVELDRALALGRTNPLVRSLRGVQWARQGKYSQALAEYLLAAEYDPENPVWQYQIGEMYAQLGDLPPALARYQRATEIAPEDPTAWRLLATFCAQNGVQVKEIGLPAAQMALELTGEDPVALDTIGWILAILERYDEARDALEHALSLEPDLAQAHLHLAVVSIQTEEWQIALEHLQTARELDLNGQIGTQAQILLNRFFP